MTDWKIVHAQLAAFEDKREVLKAMRRAIREPVPRIRDAIKAKAIAILPRAGGLGAWVAELKVSSQISVTARRVRLRLRGSRNSLREQSDLDAIDRGRVKAPAWGHRRPTAWHVQMVPSGFFTDTGAEQADDVEQAISGAVDSAFDQLRR